MRSNVDFSAYGNGVNWVTFETPQRNIMFMDNSVYIQDPKEGKRSAPIAKLAHDFVYNELKYGDNATNRVLRNAFSTLLRATIARQGFLLPEAFTRMHRFLKTSKPLGVLVVPLGTDYDFYIPVSQHDPQDGVLVIRLNLSGVHDGMFTYPSGLGYGRNRDFIKTYEPARFISANQLSYRAIGTGLQVKQGLKIVI